MNIYFRCPNRISMALACSMLVQMLVACKGYVHVSKVVGLVSRVLDKAMVFISISGASNILLPEAFMPLQQCVASLSIGLREDAVMRILDISCAAMQSKSWQVRHQALLTLNSLTSSLQVADPLFPGENKLVITPAVRLLAHMAETLKKVLEEARHDKVALPRQAAQDALQGLSAFWDEMPEYIRRSKEDSPRRAAQQLNILGSSCDQALISEIKELARNRALRIHAPITRLRAGTTATKAGSLSQGGSIPRAQSAPRSRAGMAPAAKQHLLHNMSQEVTAGARGSAALGAPPELQLTLRRRWRVPGRSPRPSAEDVLHYSAVRPPTGLHKPHTSNYTALATRQEHGDRRMKHRAAVYASEDRAAHLPRHDFLYSDRMRAVWDCGLNQHKFQLLYSHVSPRIFRPPPLPEDCRDFGVLVFSKPRPEHLIPKVQGQGPQEPSVPGSIRSIVSTTDRPNPVSTTDRPKPAARNQNKEVEAVNPPYSGSETISAYIHMPKDSSNTSDIHVHFHAQGNSKAQPTASPSTQHLLQPPLKDKEFSPCEGSSGTSNNSILVVPGLPSIPGLTQPSTNMASIALADTPVSIKQTSGQPDPSCLSFHKSAWDALACDEPDHASAAMPSATLCVSSKQVAEDPSLATEHQLQPGLHEPWHVHLTAPGGHAIVHEQQRSTGPWHLHVYSPQPAPQASSPSSSVNLGITSPSRHLAEQGAASLSASNSGNKLPFIRSSPTKVAGISSFSSERPVVVNSPPQQIVPSSLVTHSPSHSPRSSQSVSQSPHHHVQNVPLPCTGPETAVITATHNVKSQSLTFSLVSPSSSSSPPSAQASSSSSPPPARASSRRSFSPARPQVRDPTSSTDCAVSPSQSHNSSTDSGFQSKILLKESSNHQPVSPDDEIMSGVTTGYTVYSVSANPVRQTLTTKAAGMKDLTVQEDATKTQAVLHEAEHSRSDSGTGEELNISSTNIQGHTYVGGKSSDRPPFRRRQSTAVSAALLSDATFLPSSSRVGVESSVQVAPAVGAFQADSSPEQSTGGQDSLTYLAPTQSTGRQDSLTYLAPTQSTGGQDSLTYLAPTQDFASRILDFRQLVYDATTHPEIEDIVGDVEGYSDAQRSSGTTPLKSEWSQIPRPDPFEFNASRQLQDSLTGPESQLHGSLSTNKGVDDGGRGQRHYMAQSDDGGRDQRHYMAQSDDGGRDQRHYMAQSGPFPSHSLTLLSSPPVMTVHPTVGSTVYGELGMTPAPSPPFQPIPAPPMPYLSMMHIPSPLVSALTRPVVAPGLYHHVPKESQQVTHTEGASLEEDVLSDSTEPASYDRTMFSNAAGTLQVDSSMSEIQGLLDRLQLLQDQLHERPALPGRSGRSGSSPSRRVHDEQQHRRSVANAINMGEIPVKARRSRDQGRLDKPSSFVQLLSPRQSLDLTLGTRDIILPSSRAPTDTLATITARAMLPGSRPLLSLPPLETTLSLSEIRGPQLITEDRLQGLSSLTFKPLSPSRRSQDSRQRDAASLGLEYVSGLGTYRATPEGSALSKFGGSYSLSSLKNRMAVERVSALDDTGMREVATSSGLYIGRSRSPSPSSLPARRYRAGVQNMPSPVDAVLRSLRSPSSHAEPRSEAQNNSGFSVRSPLNPFVRSTSASRVHTVSTSAAPAAVAAAAAPFPLSPPTGAINRSPSPQSMNVTPSTHWGAMLDRYIDTDAAGDTALFTGSTGRNSRIASSQAISRPQYHNDLSQQRPSSLVQPVAADQHNISKSAVSESSLSPALAVNSIAPYIQSFSSQSVLGLAERQTPKNISSTMVVSPNNSSYGVLIPRDGTRGQGDGGGMALGEHEYLVTSVTEARTAKSVQVTASRTRGGSNSPPMRTRSVGAVSQGPLTSISASPVKSGRGTPVVFSPSPLSSKSSGLGASNALTTHMASRALDTAYALVSTARL
ncbi:hypothetical protein CEUSTIGMA_g2781.t1 [Chlamydomonas eustigma]|uniref:Uncharacterized protein n=1 Tax=Chlamydomonas eustigma TaxID=1157962 RepID=A0A250WX28_9CHLO|nr:hypothetical protein CEUSTIGMA_g2781.t1 [Chlamydomonas eustigma]|eukprot:GAX75336.1 hypothetical protein CEUSTIGMA_g2781.t1 [Chlamydomonas eustigma]